MKALDVELLIELCQAWLPSVAGAAVKGSILLAAALMLVRLLPRTSAAMRHLMLASALLGMLLMPLLSVLLPTWSLTWAPLMQLKPLTTAAGFEGGLDLQDLALCREVGDEGGDASAAIGSVPAATSLFSRDSPTDAVAQAGSEDSGGLVVPDGEDEAASSILPAATVAMAVWLAGCIGVLVWATAGLTDMKTRVGRALPVRDIRLQACLNELARVIGIGWQVRVLRSRCGAGPLVWGLLRPVVVLPPEAVGWDERESRLVLVHELAHVKRRDNLVQSLALLNCALHWFNPLTWIAERRLRIEQEKSCDDLVLASGAAPSEYAGLLLAAAGINVDQQVRATAQFLPRFTLKHRLLAILDGERERGMPRRLGKILPLVFIWALAAGLAAVHVGAGCEETRLVASEADAEKARFLAPSKPQSRSGGPLAPGKAGQGLSFSAGGAASRPSLSGPAPIETGPGRFFHEDAVLQGGPSIASGDALQTWAPEFREAAFPPSLRKDVPEALTQGRLDLSPPELALLDESRARAVFAAPLLVDPPPTPGDESQPPGEDDPPDPGDDPKPDPSDDGLDIQRIELPGLGGLASAAFGLNQEGTAAGVALTSDGKQHAVLWTLQGEIVDLGVPHGWDSALARKINDRQQVLVESTRTTPGGFLASTLFLWTPELGYTPVGALPDCSRALAVDLNQQGEALGVCEAETRPRSFFWSPQSGVVDLGFLPSPDGFAGRSPTHAVALNDRAQAVGVSAGQAFVWTREDGIRPIFPEFEGPGASPSAVPRRESAALSINNSGQVAGLLGRERSMLAVVEAAAFVWSEEEGQVELGVLQDESDAEYAEIRSEALAVSARGNVLGRSVAVSDALSQNEVRGFHWSSENGIREVPQLSPSSVRSATLEEEALEREEIFVGQSLNASLRDGEWTTRRYAFAWSARTGLIELLDENHRMNSSRATAVNGKAHIVGFGFVADARNGQPLSPSVQAFKWVLKPAQESALKTSEKARPQ